MRSSGKRIWRRVGWGALIGLGALVLVIAATTCQKKVEEERVKPEPRAAMVLDDESLGLGVKLGDKSNSEPTCDYKYAFSYKVGDTIAGPDAPVYSYLFGDCLAVTYIYRDDLYVIQGVMVNAWMDELCPPAKRVDPEKYFFRLTAQANKAQRLFPEIATERGIGIGDTAAEIEAAYGPPDEVNDAGWYAYEEGNFRLIFALYDGRVVMITLMSTLGTPKVQRTIARAGRG